MAAAGGLGVKCATGAQQLSHLHAGDSSWFSYSTQKEIVVPNWRKTPAVDASSCLRLSSIFLVKRLIKRKKTVSVKAQ